MSKLTERFYPKVREDEHGCWIWRGSTDSRGLYGQFSMSKGRMIGAHRASYLMFVGDIPDGYWIDHLCRVPLCVNPDHLEAVTPSVNSLRGARGMALTGYCLSGRHRIESEADIHRQPNRGRTCRECWLERGRAASLQYQARHRKHGGPAVHLLTTDGTLCGQHKHATTALRITPDIDDVTCGRCLRFRAIRSLIT